MVGEYVGYVVPGEKVSFVFKWINSGDIGFAPSFRMGVKRGDSYDKDDRGGWVGSSMVGPGGTSDQITISVNIPGDWKSGTDIDSAIFAQLDGYFDETMVFENKGWLKIPSIEASWIEITGAALVPEE